MLSGTDRSQVCVQSGTDRSQVCAEWDRQELGVC